MSDEIKITTNDAHNHNEKHHAECFCQSKGFRKFLITALGTFVGVYCALCLFSALHRPSMQPPCAMYGRFQGPNIESPCPNKIMHHHHFKHQNQYGEGRMTPFEKEKINTEN